MPRWMPRAKERLRDAAVELFLEHGFENVTVSDITRTRRADQAHLLPLSHGQTGCALRRLGAAR
ncbi:TetR family transcriptional regulator [Prauserella endophytica]|uniref:Helix-turn-helix transcriptional regulator n=1 Tax=Prauserella endophytica TaxID=1592324 RepID=A0ABY2RV80_9PSEU|nr:helix-turn-helix transcriptional regulator [Prauserella endophytica]